MLLQVELLQYGKFVIVSIKWRYLTFLFNYSFVTHDDLFCVIQKLLSERYTYSVFGFITDVIGNVFFPTIDPYHRMLVAFLVFGTAFIATPIGALVMGQLGDQRGTKLAIEISMLLLAFSSVGIGCIPLYKDINFVAPLLLVVFRFFQGFAIGGQFISSMILFMDSSQNDAVNNRAFQVSTVRLASSIGILSGNLFTYMLRNVLSEDKLDSWGWRLPFLTGCLTLIPGFFLRYCVQTEDPSDDVLTRTISPMKYSFRRFNIRPMLCLMGVVSVDSSAFYICFIWLPSFISKMLKPKIGHSYGLNAASFFLSQVAFCPIAGRIVDKYNRAIIMTIASASLGTLFPLGLFAIQKTSSGIWVVVFQTLLGSLRMLLAISYAVYFDDKFHPSIRVTSMSFGFNASFAIFGGFSPALSTALHKVQGIAPAYLVTGTSIFSLLGIWFSMSYKPPRVCFAPSASTEDLVSLNNNNNQDPSVPSNTSTGLTSPLLTDMP